MGLSSAFYSRFINTYFSYEERIHFYKTMLRLGYKISNLHNNEDGDIFIQKFKHGLNMNDFFYNYNFKKFIYLLFGSLCIFYTANLLNFEEKEFSTLFEELNYSLIFMGIGMYLLSHSARVLRLIILNPVSGYSIRSLWKEQYKANGVNLLLPLKLGESYRLIYFKNFFGSYFNSFAVLLCERLLDLLIIFFTLSFVLYSSVEVPNLDYVLWFFNFTRANFFIFILDIEDLQLKQHLI